MRRSDLTEKQQEALDKIAAVGPEGLPQRIDGRATVNGNCVVALYRIGLIHADAYRSAQNPIRLTPAGEAAQRGDDF